MNADVEEVRHAAVGIRQLRERRRRVTRFAARVNLPQVRILVTGPALGGHGPKPHGRSGPCRERARFGGVTLHACDREMFGVERERASIMGEASGGKLGGRDRVAALARGSHLGQMHVYVTHGAFHGGRLRS